MASNDEMVQIANSFLLNSPPGEFMEVVTDVRRLLPNETLINSSAPATFRQYNLDQLVVVESPSTDNPHKLVVSKYGEVADGEFLDPQGKQVIFFDHIKQIVTGARPVSSEIDESLEPLRSAFEKEVLTYVSEHYPNGAASVYGKDGQIIICISSARFNPNNFWNGRWRSVWTFSNGELNARLKLVVHYYEDGNVQLNTEHSFKQSVAEGSSPSATATAAVKALAKAEQNYQSSMEASYNTMGDTTFKALRRALPITRQRIDWNKIRNYKIGGDLSK
jgi:capping protein alpha